MSEQQGRRRRIEAELMDDGRLEGSIMCTAGEAVAILADLIVNVAKVTGTPLPIVLTNVTTIAFKISMGGMETITVDLSNVSKPGGHQNAGG